MSQYINFFIRKQIKDEIAFIPIGSFSRSCYIYKAITDAPYEKIRPLKYEELNDIIRELHASKREYEDDIKNIEHTITNMIPSFNNSIEEKMQEIQQQRGYIADISEDIVDIQFSIGYFRALQEIIYDNSNSSSSRDDIIYYGVEIGSPTEEDVV